VALVFGVAEGGRSAGTAILLAAAFAGVGVLASLSRLFDFVRFDRPDRQAARAGPRGLHEPAE